MAGAFRTGRAGPGRPRDRCRGPNVQERGRAALAGTPDAVREFLARGQYQQRAQDERVATVQILSMGGPAVRAAGRLALQSSPADIGEFLEVGQHVARARDQEHLTVAQLAQLAKEAGRQAAAETAAAKSESARAVEASKLAKAAALRAADEASKAADDATKAASAAGRAAAAATQAARTCARISRNPLASPPPEPSWSTPAAPTVWASSGGPPAPTGR
ncbi:ALF repeat-containing protein [Streptomyces sp. RMIT01]